MAEGVILGYAVMNDKDNIFSGYQYTNSGTIVPTWANEKYDMVVYCFRNKQKAAEVAARECCKVVPIYR